MRKPKLGRKKPNWIKQQNGKRVGAKKQRHQYDDEEDYASEESFAAPKKVIGKRARAESDDEESKRIVMQSFDEASSDVISIPVEPPVVDQESDVNNSGLRRSGRKYQLKQNTFNEDALAANAFKLH